MTSASAHMYFASQLQFPGFFSVIILFSVLAERLMVVVVVMVVTVVMSVMMTMFVVVMI